MAELRTGHPDQLVEGAKMLPALRVLKLQGREALLLEGRSLALSPRETWGLGGFVYERR